jgi:hypothetical protein
MRYTSLQSAKRIPRRKTHALQSAVRTAPLSWILSRHLRPFCGGCIRAVRTLPKSFATVFVSIMLRLRLPRSVQMAALIIASAVGISRILSMVSLSISQARYFLRLGCFLSLRSCGFTIRTSLIRNAVLQSRPVKASGLHTGIPLG